MEIEKQYAAVLELTQKMLSAASIQDWGALTQIEKQRARLVYDAVHTNVILSPSEKGKIAALIVEIERESAEIVTRVQGIQEHTKILLRLNTPAS